MTVQQRQLEWIRPVLAEKADSAREALAFTRASLRTLQNLNPSDGDALFLAHASRDVAARRVVDALLLLSITFGAPAPTAGKISKKKSLSSSSAAAGGGSGGGGGGNVPMGWETLVSSLSEFDKTTVGPVILQALKPMVRQLRLDIARRTENIQDDMEMKPSLRAAKTVGAWLGSIVRWKEDYESSLVTLDLLSAKKSGLERMIQEALGTRVL
jgi:hypothetical protein